MQRHLLSVRPSLCAAETPFLMHHYHCYPAVMRGVRKRMRRTTF